MVLLVFDDALLQVIYGPDVLLFLQRSEGSHGKFRCFYLREIRKLLFKPCDIRLGGNGEDKACGRHNHKALPVSPEHPQAFADQHLRRKPAYEGTDHHQHADQNRRGAASQRVLEEHLVNDNRQDKGTADRHAVFENWLQHGDRNGVGGRLHAALPEQKQRQEGEDQSRQEEPEQIAAAFQIHAFIDDHLRRFVLVVGHIGVEILHKVKEGGQDGQAAVFYGRSEHQHVQDMGNRRLNDHGSPIENGVNEGQDEKAAGEHGAEDPHAVESDVAHGHDAEPPHQQHGGNGSRKSDHGNERDQQIRGEQRDDTRQPGGGKERLPLHGERAHHVAGPGVIQETEHRHHGDDAHKDGSLGQNGRTFEHLLLHPHLQRHMPHIPENAFTEAVGYTHGEHEDQEDKPADPDGPASLQEIGRYAFIKQ